jgi:hypothetical protein
MTGGSFEGAAPSLTVINVNGRICRKDIIAFWAAFGRVVRQPAKGVGLAVPKALA